MCARASIFLLCLVSLFSLAAQQVPGQYTLKSTEPPILNAILGGDAGENIYGLRPGNATDEIDIQGEAAASDPEVLKMPELPLAFEPNLGQAPGEVEILSRSASSQILLSGQSIMLRPRGTSSAIRMDLAGAEPQAGWRTESRLGGVSNYLIGADPSLWRTGIARYARARLRRPYPGIDLLVYGNEGRMEFDFVVEPGADPSRIRMCYQGVDSTAIDEAGNLILRTGAGEVWQHRPVIYQELASGRRIVSGEYVRLGAGEVGFRVGEYDRSEALVIDPIITYGTYLGGSGLDAGYAIALDATGAAYIAGSTESVDFPATSGEYAGGTQPADAFVTKLNADGTDVEYATFLGGSRDDMAAAIAVDANGNAYVTGTTYSADFPVTRNVVGPASLDPASDGRGDAFVVKLSPTGEEAVYSTYLSGNESDAGTAIAIDARGYAFIAGQTYSNNFPTIDNAHRKSNCAGEGPDGFYTRLTPTATAISYSTYLCGSGDDLPRGIAVDPYGAAYIAGKTNSIDYPVTAGAINAVGGGANDDGFITKIGPGGVLVWSTYLGGGGNDAVESVQVVFPLGWVYVAGTTDSTNLPTTPGVFQGSHADLGQYTDGFVAGIEATSVRLRFLTYFGGSREDAIHSLAVDGAGNLYLAGYTSSPDLPTTSSPCLTAYRGNGDAFIANLKPIATELRYALFLGGSQEDRAHGVAIDAAGDAYLTGQTWSANFPTIPESYRPAYKAGFQGVADAFVVKVSADDKVLTNRCVAINGVVNNGSMLPGPVSPGEIISIFGVGLGPESLTPTHLEGNYLATRVGGTRVLFDGEPSPVIFSSKNQVAAVVPYSVGGTTVMEVEYFGFKTPEVLLGVTDASPAILTQNSSGTGPGAILNQDYTRNTPANPAPRGSYIMIYATGEGQTAPLGDTGAIALSVWPQPLLPVQVLFGEVPSPDTPYHGAAPGYVAGLLQVNAQVPLNIAAGDAVPLTLIIGDKRSPIGVTVAVE